MLSNTGYWQGAREPWWGNWRELLLPHDLNPPITKKERRAIEKRFGKDRERTFDPATRSYWVVPGQLIAGCYPGAFDQSEEYDKLSPLVEVANVDTFVNLMEMDWERSYTGEDFAPYDETAQYLLDRNGKELRYHNFPIIDRSTTTGRAMVTILDTIDRAIFDGRTVYVHCRGGYGRTGTVVACWLRRHGLAKSGDDAIRIIRWLRENDPMGTVASPETGPQRDFVRAWRQGQ